MKKLNRNLNEEEDYNELLEKFYYSTKLRRRTSTGRDSRRFCLREKSDSFNIPAAIITLTSFLPFEFFFKDQRTKEGSDFEPDSMAGFQKNPVSHWQANTYRALSFDRRNFFNMLHLQKLAFSACQMTAKSLVL